jgi:BCD family chlorophyll transporter-like MFS transporter
MERPLGWFGIFRLGLVQTALGAIVVLTTSTINRVMIVELSFMAVIPGVLVAWHYALQVLRPRWGHGSDNGGRRTPWIIGGMATLALGGFLAAVSTWLAASHYWAGLMLAAVAFTLVGIGVGAAGTSMLVLLAQTVEQGRRAAAATIVWTMMIMGFILTTVTAGKMLDPFSLPRLVAIAGGVGFLAFTLSVVSIAGLERRHAQAGLRMAERPATPFAVALSDVWNDAEARNFAIFIFMSMLAYSAQDLVLEPFAGLQFGYSPGQTTALSGTQNGGVLCGMLVVGIAATLFGRTNGLVLRSWAVAGCIASALALFGLVGAAHYGMGWPLVANVFALGFANGMFAVAAIGSMFTAAMGHQSREGVRMGLFGASQAIAFGAGGFCGTVIADTTFAVTHSHAASYGLVFAIEAMLFMASSLLALGMSSQRSHANPMVLAANYDLHG